MVIYDYKTLKALAYTISIFLLQAKLSCERLDRYYIFISLCKRFRKFWNSFKGEWPYVKE